MWQELSGGERRRRRRQRRRALISYSKRRTINNEGSRRGTSPSAAFRRTNDKSMLLMQTRTDTGVKEQQQRKKRGCQSMPHHRRRCRGRHQNHPKEKKSACSKCKHATCEPFALLVWRQAPGEQPSFFTLGEREKGERVREFAYILYSSTPYRDRVGPREEAVATRRR